MNDGTLDYDQPVRDYYKAYQPDSGSLRFRLDGSDSIKQVGDILRGGWVKDKKGQLVPNTQYRLMSEKGVSRVDLILRSSVSKINHLTNYKNEERVLKQQRSLSKAFLQELVLNMKEWGATIIIVVPLEKRASYDVATSCGSSYLETTKEEIRGDKAYIYVKIKVQNKHIVLQVVENVIYQSFLRAIGGKEAQMTAPNVLIQEQQQVEQQQQRRGLFGLLGKRGGEQYG